MSMRHTIEDVLTDVENDLARFAAARSQHHGSSWGHAESYATAITVDRVVGRGKAFRVKGYEVVIVVTPPTEGARHAA